ncbi:MAG: creatininase family protein [Desulfobacterales bacterium]|nr:creatininase family protein [Desulfobacterales bacterium]
MNIADMNWFKVESYLKFDDRVILPLGSTEQHAYLSLCTDFILSEKLAKDAGGRCDIPVYPGLPFGVAPYFSAFPGTVTLRPETYKEVVLDLLSSLHKSGFRRILILNGHGGNSHVQEHLGKWQTENAPNCQLIFHDWWASQKVMEAVHRISPNASHASWMENFPWTRLKDVEMPTYEKKAVDRHTIQHLSPEGVREYIGDGNYGGAYEAGPEAMLEIWRIATQEVCELLESGWT